MTQSTDSPVGVEALPAHRYEYRASRASKAWQATETGHRTAWCGSAQEAREAAAGYGWRNFWLERRTKAGPPERMPS